MCALWMVRVQVSAALMRFIKPRRREATLRLRWCAKDDLKHRIETLGIPHTEVGAVYADGTARTWSWCPPADASVQVLGYAEAPPEARLLLHPPLPVPPRFAADAHLGRVVGYLRLFGFDTVLPPEAGDAALAERAACEGRVLLTRDRSLLMHRVVTRGAYVHAQQPRAQLQEVVARYALRGCAAPFSRCLHCNGLLQSVDPVAVSALVPPQVAARHSRYMRCAGCARVYWPGSHYERMAAWVAQVLGHPNS